MCTQQGSKLRSASSLRIFFHLLCTSSLTWSQIQKWYLYCTPFFINTYFIQNKIPAKESPIKKKKKNTSASLVYLDYVLLMNKTSELKHLLQDQSQTFSPALLSASSSPCISQAPGTHARGRIWQLSHPKVQIVMN